MILNILPNTVTNLYRYDSLYRLTNEVLSVSAPTGNLGYWYDSVGNRTNRTGSLASLNAGSSSFNANDELGSDIYDANGNTKTNAGNDYRYDFENHLAYFNNRGAVITYDGDGNRVVKEADAVTALYLVDTHNPSGYAQVLEELTSSGGTTTLSRAYTWGSSLISQRQPGVSTNFFVFDGHGSTRLLTDGSGSVVNAFAYDAYGTLIASNGTAQTTYLYCAQQIDPYLNLSYNRARYSNLGMGRFLTCDSHADIQEDPLSLHKYLYSQDNPVNRIDPTGYYSSWKQELGYQAEKAIDDEYISTHPIEQVPFIEFGAYQYYNISEYLKPDIFNSWELRFLEIKPISLSGIAKGETKIILDALRFGPTYSADTEWQPRTFTLRTGSGSIIFAHNVQGVVYYQDVNDLELKLIETAVIVTADDLLNYLKFSDLADWAPELTRISDLIRVEIAGEELELVSP